MSSSSSDRNPGTELDVVLPVHNEAQSIEATVRSIHDAASKLGHHRFIIVEDGSSDGTQELLQRLAGELPITLATSDVRRGYSAAMRTALTLCSSPYILCIDADGQYDPADISALWRCRNQAALVSGWRVRRAEGLGRRIGSAVFACGFQVVFRVPVHDPSSSLILMNRAVVQTLLPRLGYMPEAFWWEFSGTAHQLGFSFLEVPVLHRPRAAGTTRIYTAAKLPAVVCRQVAGLARMLWDSGQRRDNS